MHTGMHAERIVKGMKKVTRKLALLLCFVMLATALVACGGSSDGGSSDSGKTDAVTGTWKQTDEVNGDWTWTFSGGSKAKLVGNTTGFESDGTYTLDEANKKLKIKLEKWDAEKEYDYTLNGTTLDLNEKYSSYHLTKQ